VHSVQKLSFTTSAFDTKQTKNNNKQSNQHWIANWRLQPPRNDEFYPVHLSQVKTATKGSPSNNWAHHVHKNINKIKKLSFTTSAFDTKQTTTKNKQQTTKNYRSQLVHSIQNKKQRISTRQRWSRLIDWNWTRDLAETNSNSKSNRRTQNDNAGLRTRAKF
jgi:hypothetical protein